jgi:peptide chain release factor 1
MDRFERLDELESRFEEVTREMSSPEVASDPDRMRTLGKSYADLRQIVEPYREYRSALRDAEDARQLAANEQDAEMTTYLRKEAEEADARAASLSAKLEELLVPRDPNDQKDVVVEIRAGTGGEEAALWAGDLLELYRHFAERRGWKTDVLGSSPSDLGGFKEVVLEVRGKGAYSALKHESGVHRVQRVPVTESSGKLHTSAATVAVLPEAEDIEVHIDPDDIEMQAYHSSGPGGQSVNTSNSAVRITHKPTGIVVATQEERSQLQNREKAMRYLRARLLQMAQEEARSKEAAERRSQVGTGDRSERIRTYNFPQNRVTDHRVKQEVDQLPLQSVLAGDIDAFVEALGARERARQLAEGASGNGGSSDGSPNDGPRG